MPTTGSILVVDDHTDSREMIAEYLSCIGFAVSTAADGAEAVTRAEQLRPDVVLMDLALPGVLDGWEATRRIKASPAMNRTVVIALTAHAFPQEREQALRAGCCAVFSKPVDVTALTASLQQAIRDHTPAAS
jgi:two-component system, cell cycle response regulator DivK